MLRLLARMQRLAQSFAEIAGARNSASGWRRRSKSRAGDVVSPLYDGAFPARLRHRPQHGVTVQCRLCGAITRDGWLSRYRGDVERRSAVVRRFRRCARVCSCRKKTAGWKLPRNWLGCFLRSRDGCASALRPRRQRERCFRTCSESSIRVCLLRQRRVSCFLRLASPACGRTTAV